jgi:hypothetical protein
MLTPVIVNALPKASAGSDSVCAWHSHAWPCTWIDTWYRSTGKSDLCHYGLSPEAN